MDDELDRYLMDFKLHLVTRIKSDIMDKCVVYKAANGDKLFSLLELDIIFTDAERLKPDEVFIS